MPAGIISPSIIKDIFLIDEKNERIILKTDKLILPISNITKEALTLTENNETIDVEKYSSVNYTNIWADVDDIEFSLSSPKGTINICIEGSPAENSLELPLAFSQQRFEKLFDDEYYVELLNETDKYSLDNCEFKVVGTRARLLSLEKNLVANQNTIHRWQLSVYPLKISAL